MALTDRFADALTYANALHAEQRRKASDVPYISHLLGVVSLAIEHGADEDESIAALLHDAVEDQGGAGQLEAIRARFGERVAKIVDGCTDAYVQPKPPWRERKEQHLEELHEADASVRLVVGCDKLHNARALVRDYVEMGETLWQRFRGGRDGTLWYYRAVTDALAAQPSPLWRELEREVALMERLAQAQAQAEAQTQDT